MCSVPVRQSSPRNRRSSPSPAIARLGACVGLSAGFDLAQCICCLPPSYFLSHGFSSSLPLCSLGAQDSRLHAVKFSAPQFGLHVTEEGSLYMRSICVGRTSGRPEGPAVYALHCLIHGDFPTVLREPPRWSSLAEAVIRAPKGLRRFELPTHGLRIWLMEIAPLSGVARDTSTRRHHRTNHSGW